MLGRTNEARAHLISVTNAMYADLKQRLNRNLERNYLETNAPAAPLPAQDKSARQ